MDPRINWIGKSRVELETEIRQEAERYAEARKYLFRTIYHCLTCGDLVTLIQPVFPSVYRHARGVRTR